jgi:hypothetical protein
VMFCKVGVDVGSYQLGWGVGFWAHPVILTHHLR